MRQKRGILAKILAKAKICKDISRNPSEASEEKLK